MRMSMSTRSIIHLQQTFTCIIRIMRSITHPRCPGVNILFIIHHNNTTTTKQKTKTLKHFGERHLDKWQKSLRCVNCI